MHTDRTPVNLGMASVALAGALCLLLLGVRAAGGAVVEDLYLARVPVSGKSAKVREDAVSAALNAVLVKVSGMGAPAREPVIGKALRSPSRYLQQYRYETVMKPGEDGRPQPAELLAVRFDPAAVDRLLLSAGLPVWSRVRPSLLAWLAVEQAGVRTLVGASDVDRIAHKMVAAARTRGVPLLVPLLDLGERASIPVADVWGGFLDRIRLASERYRADGLLIGREYQRSDSSWEVRWTLAIDTARDDWMSAGATFEQALESGIDAAADRLAGKYAQRAVEVGQVTLTVLDVNSLEDYGRLIRYLQAIDLVKEVAVSELEGSQVRLGVRVRGGLQALLPVLRLGQTLAAGSDPVPGSGTGAAPAGQIVVRLAPP